MLYIAVVRSMLYVAVDRKNYSSGMPQGHHMFVRSVSSQADCGHLQIRCAKMSSVPKAAHPLAGKMFTRYYFQSCPREFECSAQSWKRQRYCESYKSEDEARTLLRNHLMKSSMHNHNEDRVLSAAASDANLITELVSGRHFQVAPGPEANAGGEVDSPCLSIQCTGDSRNGTRLYRQLRWPAC